VQISRFLPRLRNARIIIAAFYVVIAVTAGYYPLVNELHYEFSALIALSASLLAGVAVIYRPRQLLPEADGSPHPIDGATLWDLVARNVLLALIPLGVALLRSLAGTYFGIGEGIAWYLLLVPPSAAIATVLAALTELMIRRRWLRSIVFLLLWSASLLRGAYEGYSGPHIFLYAWQMGFFPGGSWDAELPVSARLIIYRAVHLLAAAALAVVVIELGALRHGRGGTTIEEADGAAPSTGRTFRRPSVALAAIIAVAILPLLPYRSDLGVTRTDAWLRGALGDSLRTRFATIYYNAPSTDSLDIWRAANLADFYITEHAATLGIPEGEIAPVTIYLYASPSEEQRLVGTSSAAFTKPWARMLNMSFGSVGSTLRHELAHVMMAPFGNPLGISTSQGLIEGSAMALENDYLWRTLHQYARAMYQYGLAPEAEGIMGVTGFSSRRTSVSYVLAGSFSKWLIERYGMKPYLQAFPWSDFEGAYGRSLHALSEEYRRFIDSLPPADADYRATSRYLFGGGSFFLQKSLRRIGSLNGAGYQAIAEERYELALKRFGESLEEGINYGARGGVLRALSGMGNFRALLDSAANYDRDTASYPLLPFLIERGDACWGLGDTAGARRLYDSVLALDISQQLTLRAAQRRYFLDAPDSLGSIMRIYYTRPMGVPQRLQILDRAMTKTATHGERLMLSLLRATLTVNQLPRTSLGGLRPLFSSKTFMGEFLSTTRDYLHGFRLEAFIDGSLAEQLRPAMMLSADRGLLKPGEEIPGELLGLPRILGFTLPDIAAGRSAEYQRERRTEQARFSRYLEMHAILPK